jgi:hypothetical protein
MKFTPMLLQLRHHNLALSEFPIQPFGGMDLRLMLPALPPPSI